MGQSKEFEMIRRFIGAKLGYRLQASDLSVGFANAYESVKSVVGFTEQRRHEHNDYGHSHPFSDCPLCVEE